MSPFNRAFPAKITFAEWRASERVYDGVLDVSVICLASYSTGFSIRAAMSSATISISGTAQSMSFIRSCRSAESFKAYASLDSKASLIAGINSSFIDFFKMKLTAPAVFAASLYSSISKMVRMSTRSSGISFFS